MAEGGLHQFFFKLALGRRQLQRRGQLLANVLATLRMQEVDRAGAPLGQPIELFVDKPFGIGNQAFELQAARMRHGNFTVKLTAKAAADPSQTDEENAYARIIFSQSEALPVGHVIVSGVKVRDGTLMAQTQSMSLAGRSTTYWLFVAHTHRSNCSWA